MARTNNSFESYQSLRKKLEQKQYDPVYLFQGDETYFIDELTELIEQHALTESEKAFNQTILYGKEVKDIDIVSAAKRFPMMADRQVVIVKEAQNIKKWDAMLPYLKEAHPTTILVVAMKGGKIAGNTKVGKAFKKFTVFNSTPLRDYQLAPAVKSVIEASGFEPTADALPILFELYGTNLQRTFSELKKLRSHVDEGTVLSRDVLLEHLTENREFNIFEYQAALAQGDMNKLLKISNYFADHKKTFPIMIFTSNMYNLFSRLVRSRKGGRLDDRLALSNSYHVRKAADELKMLDRRFPGKRVEVAIQALSKLDAASKGMGWSNAEDRELYRDFAIALLGK
jgi:DNA polymerase-3 subunit delta